jgi:FkbM family methyltransferase
MTAAHEMKHWPAYTTPNEKPYTLKHVRMLEETLGLCKHFRTAVQAGGSIGYWPRRMAERFELVYTFEPEPLIRECLVKNLAGYNVIVRPEALGPEKTRCAISRRGFGSHVVVEGDDIDMVTIDSLAIEDLDLLQLDIEGFEIHALIGGSDTIVRCRPVIQVEVLGDMDPIASFMRDHAYRLALTLGGRDHVFVPQ